MRDDELIDLCENRSRHVLDGGFTFSVDRGPGLPAAIAKGQLRSRGNGGPVDQFQFAGVTLDERRTVLDPVTGIAIGQIAKMIDPGNMNVSANHTITFQIFRMADESILKIADELDRLFGPDLHVGTESTLFEAKAPSHLIDQNICPDQLVVAKSTEH